MKTYRVMRGVLPLPADVRAENRRPEANQTFTTDSSSRFLRRALANGDIVEVVEKGPSK